MYGIINKKINFRTNKYEVMRGLWKGLAVPSNVWTGNNGGWRKGKKED